MRCAQRRPQTRPGVSSELSRITEDFRDIEQGATHIVTLRPPAVLPSRLIAGYLAAGTIAQPRRPLLCVFH